MNRGVILPNKFEKLISPDFRRIDISKLNTFTSVNLLNEEMSSFDEILTIGFLENTKFLRDSLKKIDFLLKTKGRLRIIYSQISDPYCGGSAVRPLSFVMYELSISYKLRYRLISKTSLDGFTELVYDKIEESFTENDSINKWSFGIVSDGRKNDRLKFIIDQIIGFRIPDFEIMICGPKPDFDFLDCVTVFTDSDLYNDIRVPITAKKNRLIFAAKNPNLVIMHDRISFPENWYERMVVYGNQFEILSNKILDEQSKSKRVQDWISLNGDFEDYEHLKAGLIPYEHWNSRVYTDGGFIIAKTSVLKHVDGYNEALHWGEAEDVDLSVRLYNAGFITNIDLHNEVYTETHRHSGKDPQDLFAKPSFIRLLFRFFKTRYLMDMQRKQFDKLVLNYLSKGYFRES